jgi:hypothetical protein
LIPQPAAATAVAHRADCCYRFLQQPSKEAAARRQTPDWPQKSLSRKKATAMAPIRNRPSRQRPSPSIHCESFVSLSVLGLGAGILLSAPPTVYVPDSSHDQSHAEKHPALRESVKPGAFGMINGGCAAAAT